MSRFIENLPEWHVEDLIDLLIEGRRSMDAALASGEDSSILTDRQLAFIQQLIKKKGGKIPTYEEIFGK